MVDLATFVHFSSPGVSALTNIHSYPGILPLRFYNIHEYLGIKSDQASDMLTRIQTYMTLYVWPFLWHAFCQRKFRHAFSLEFWGSGSPVLRPSAAAMGSAAQRLRDEHGLHRSPDFPKLDAPHSWMICKGTYPNLKWMITRATPIFLETTWNHHVLNT